MYQFPLPGGRGLDEAITPMPHTHTSYFLTVLLSYNPLVAEAFEMEYYSIQSAKETHCLTITTDFEDYYILNSYLCSLITHACHSLSQGT
jgi:hypothetical protein